LSSERKGFYRSAENAFLSSVSAYQKITPCQYNQQRQHQSTFTSFCWVTRHEYDYLPSSWQRFYPNPAVSAELLTS
jgi:hypothetical protein